MILYVYIVTSFTSVYIHIKRFLIVQLTFQIYEMREENVNFCIDHSVWGVVFHFHGLYKSSFIHTLCCIEILIIS